MFKLLKELPKLLSEKEKKNFYLIFPLMLFTMGLETLGLGLILPTLKVIFDQQSFNNPSFYGNFLYF